jgi:hypothetical protein
MRKIFLSGALRNQLQPAVRCYMRIYMEGMKRTVINDRILASGPIFKSETSELQITLAIS